MIRMLAFSLSAVALLAAVPAAAADIHIQIAGKDDATVRQDIRQAARRVCDVDSSGIRVSLEMQSCVAYAVRDAEGQLVQARAIAARNAEVKVAQAK